MIYKTNIITKLTSEHLMIILCRNYRYTGEQHSRLHLNDYQNNKGINIYGHTFNENIYIKKTIAYEY